MRKFALAIAGAVSGMLMMVSPAHADCGEVSITEMNWASGIVVTAVSKFLLEQGYGCDVTVVPSSTVTAVTSLAETGEPDIVTELWINAAPVYHELEAEGKVMRLADVLSDGGVEGFWIPDYLAEAHPELKTMEGILANPDLVGGRFHNCPAGWACRVTSANIAKAWGVPEAGIEIFEHGSGETLAASIAAAYASKEPWFGYYWNPTSVLGKYPMVSVYIGDYDKEAFECNAMEDCANPGRSSWPKSVVITTVTSDFAEKNPEVAQLMKKVSFTNAEMAGVLAWQEDNSASPEEAAVHFLSNYKDVWSSWISDEAKSNLGSLLQ